MEDFIEALESFSQSIKNLSEEEVNLINRTLDKVFQPTKTNNEIPYYTYTQGDVIDSVGYLTSYLGFSYEDIIKSLKSF